MRYQKIYSNLIQNARNRILQDVYTEEHHIIPLSLGGLNTADNLIKLTAKEHYIAHHLLYKIHRNREMTMAFMLMVNIKRDGQKFRITAKSYQLLKEDNARVRRIAMTGSVSPAKGKKWSAESKAKLSASQKGHGRGNSGSRGFKGKHWTQEQKDLISKRMTGKKTHLGILHSEETKKKMSEDRLGKTKIPWTEERKAARRALLAEKFNKEKGAD
jgi:hypothetical protein